MSGINRDPDGHYNLNYANCAECGGLYVSREMHLRSERHREWEKGEMEVPVPKQPPPRTYKYVPDHIEFGRTILCPDCGHRKKPKKNCVRCDGLGVVPNVGV